VDDRAIYGVHAAFWAAFLLTRALLRTKKDEAAPATERAHAAPHARLLVALHGTAFGVIYFGLGNAVLPRRVPEWFPGQRWVGLAVLGFGAFIACSAVAAFRSWRLQAQLDKGHELATGGPFRFVRHPIYLALDLFAIGTAIWVPSTIVWIGVGLMVLVGDLRGRAEEKLLTGAFGETYKEYCARTARLIPGVY
jgi:protein-S-isoprenylcysteine O-methyltransferase Ste14